MIAIDHVEIRKKYTKKMEFMGKLYFVGGRDLVYKTDDASNKLPCWYIMADRKVLSCTVEM